MGSAMRNMLALKDEVMYTSMPLYHMAAGAVGTCQAIVHGDTIAIRSKFSASKFWEDCIKYQCTVSFFYFAVLFVTPFFTSVHNILANFAVIYYHNRENPPTGSIKLE